MGYRTVVSDGKVWKSYDERTNQIFIQKPDKKLEKSLFSWVKFKKLKAIPVKLESDGGYRIKLLGKGNDVRTYFEFGTNKLISIVIIQGDVKSEIFDFTLTASDTISFELGSVSSTSFDLR
jgi:outer membrane lipoprotein-sorting protein